jgi:hypothetical protein
MSLCAIAFQLDSTKVNAREGASTVKQKWKIDELFIAKWLFQTLQITKPQQMKCKKT